MLYLVVNRGQQHRQLDSVHLSIANDDILCPAARFLKRRHGLLLQNTRVDEGLHRLHSLLKLLQHLLAFEEGRH